MAGQTGPLLHPHPRIGVGITVLRTEHLPGLACTLPERQGHAALRRDT